MSPRVLVLTTRTAFAEPLSVALRASDLDYVGARSLEAGLELASTEDLPSAVVIDLMCISGDAASLCDAVRGREQGGAVPIIFCGTGAESINSTSDALIAGGDGYVSVPCEAQRIVAKLATYLACPVPELPPTLLLPGAEVPADAAPETLAANSAGDDEDEKTPVPQPTSEMLDVTMPVPAPAPVSGLPRGRSSEGGAAVTQEGGTVSDTSAQEEEFAQELADNAISEARARAEAEREQAERQAAARAHELELERLRAEAEAEELRVHEERARLRALEAERKQAEAEAAAALEEAQRKSAEERARLVALEAQRQAAEQDAERAMHEAQSREDEERVRLESLAQSRAEAEDRLAKTLDESARREIEARHALEETERAKEQEQARLTELLRQREAAEREAESVLDETARRIEEAQRSLAETQAREEEERGRLAALEIERHTAEAEAASARAEAITREATLKAALEDLERHRRALEEEARRKEDENRRRAAEEADRLRILEDERRRLEEQARVEDAERAKRTAHEERELNAIAERRRRAEEELREAISQRVTAIAEEEQRLNALRAARDTAERSERDAIADREREARDAQLKLDEARRLRAEVEQQAQQELEQLRRMRAEEELARRELEEKRARARLAFQSGRLDAVAPGENVGGIDVGSRGRPLTDADGNVLGGGLLPVVPIDVEPPPPLPFVALEPAQGRFADGELASLLWAAHGLKVTGAIDVGAEDGRTRTLYLEDGEPVLVASTLTADRPEEGLLRAGLITAATYNELRAGPLRSPRRTAAALVADGVLKTEELFPAVRGVLVEQVLSLLEWEGGSFSYREERAHAADRVRLEHRLGALLAEGVRRKVDERRLWSVLGGPSTLIGPDDRARDLPPLSPEEKVALARFDGTRSLEDVIVETAIAVPVVLRTALIAVSCGAARVLARGVPADPNERMQMRERAVGIDRARVMDRLQAARHGDYFTFLGVDAHASAFEVHRAAERIRQRFDPARFSDPAFGDLRAALQEIHDVSLDAESVLADESLADGYRRSVLASGTPRVAHKRTG